VDRPASDGAQAGHRFVLCDVFSATPLAGSPLAVFVDGDAVPEALLQPLARELNFTETVFLGPPSGDADRRIRFFTPTQELPFAGYPLIGAALVVADGRRDAVTLQTGVGNVRVALEHLGAGRALAWMDQPVPAVRPYDRPADLLGALGVSASALPVEVYDNGVEHVLIALESPEAVASLEPDLAALRRLGVRANAFAGAGAQWTTRMFAPVDGIAEDIATGSAAGPLACHLVRHGVLAAETEVMIRQGAQVGRPSLLRARAGATADAITTVRVGGAAIVVGDGRFSVPGPTD
jgi:trans-2,3-dihydro-3-hydroxyanthranilate isomerase